MAGSAKEIDFDWMRLAHIAALCFILYGLEESNFPSSCPSVRFFFFFFFFFL